MTMSGPSKDKPETVTQVHVTCETINHFQLLVK